MTKIKAAKIGNTVTIVVDQQVLVNSNLNSNDVERVLLLAKSKEAITSEELTELLMIMAPAATKEKIEEAAIQQEKIVKREANIKLASWLDGIVDDPNFEVKDNMVYMRGINISMPKVLVERIMVADKETLESYKNFWRLCALNPNPQAREDLFQFLEKYKFSITKNGYFIAYRHVVLKNRNSKYNKQAMTEFISEHFFKVKAWKKSPKNYSVVKVGGEPIVMDKNRPFAKEDIQEVFGDLDYLYYLITEMDDTAIFTDNHTKTFTIKLGVPVVMERKGCDNDPKRDCSSGLHVGTPSFVNSNNFGDCTIVCLINPMHVVAVPAYNVQKMRVCEYLPYAVCPLGTDKKISDMSAEVFDDEYTTITSKQIDNLLANSTFEELRKQELIPYEIKEESVFVIAKDIAAIANEAIKNRVVKVKKK